MTVGKLIFAAFGVCLGCLRSHAQGEGTSAQGNTGGLVIPYADVLPDRGLALSYGNFPEPKFVSSLEEHNAAFGLGLLNYVEVFGRFASYTNTPTGDYLNSGARDLSANVKVLVPFLPKWGPQVAFGKNDLAGGNTLFESTYGVITQRWHTLSGSLGYARRPANLFEESFAGIFGGVEWRLDPTGLSLLAEYDGQVSHAGARWQSPPLKTIGDLRVGATLQRSHGASFPNGDDADATSFAVHMNWPVGNLDIRRRDFQPSLEARLKDVPAEDSSAAGVPPEENTARLTSLRRALESAGLERVRVGVHSDSLNRDIRDLVVEYENHRYAQNEVDAIGLVLGMGSEIAPMSLHRIRAVTLKDGLRVYETTVDLATYRAFLRNGKTGAVRKSLTWESGHSEASSLTQWESDVPSGTTRLRFVIKPGLNYTVGTELGAFDYSLAAKPMLVAPLWPGAKVTTGYSIPLHQSYNMVEGRALDEFRHRMGLETMSLGQSFWMGRRIVANLSAGRFHFDAWGAQSEVQAFVPGTSDIVRLRGTAYDQAPGGIEGGDKAGTVSYRRMWGPANWTELGWHLYSDGTAGPSFEWTRWTSDVGVTLFGRQGGDTRFAGLKISVPLTPRRGMKPYFATLAGPEQHAQSLRTAFGAPINAVQPASVRDMSLTTGLDETLFNHGRMNEAYMEAQLPRMREAYYLYSTPD